MPDLSDPAVHKLTAEILARPEYAQATAPDSLFERLARLLLDWLGKLELLRVKAPIAYWMIIVALVVVFVALVLHLVWTLWVALSAPQPATVSRAEPARRDLAGEAEALAAAGRHLEAAHRLMLASFRLLAERSVIDLRPDRPNRWIRAALHGSPLGEALAREVAGLIEQTEQLWFGSRRDEPAIYARWRSAFERLCAHSG